MPDPQPFGWGEAIAAAVAGGIPGIAALFKGRGAGGLIHGVRNKAQEAISRVAVVEKGMEDIGARLGRMEDKLDRLVERR